MILKSIVGVIPYKVIGWIDGQMYSALQQYVPSKDGHMQMHCNMGSSKLYFYPRNPVMT